MINYDEEIRNFRSSLDISAVEDQIVQSDLTDMKDILMELRRLSQGDNPSQELLEDIALITKMLNDMKEERK